MEKSKVQKHILNQKNETKIDKKYENIDEESEFLLEEYDQSSSIDDYEETLNEKTYYEGVKVITMFLNICFIV